MGVSVKLRLGAAVLVSGLALGALAQDKATVSDAQVEASVLKALASAPELSTQNIQSTTVYGVVTLSGSANDEASRSKAENLVARVPGVKKVVDEMTLGGTPAVTQAGPANGQVLQSDGSYAPAEPEQGAMAQQNAQPEPGYTSPPAPPAAAQYPPQGQAPQGGQYPQQASGDYPPPSNGQYPPRRPMYRGYPAQPAYTVQGGQQAGRPVTIPSGSLVRIRINQGLSTEHSKPGFVFDGVVLNDVIADGAVAIPRGAAVQGTVVDVKDAGALKGRGELSLQLTRLNLGGQSYTLASDMWKQTGPDKTVRTVNSALGLGALGAVFGAVAGGGKGAAIGAGVGGAAGLASSAASPGHLFIFPETVLTFHIAQPTTVATVSEQEMGRLSYAAGPNPGQPVVQRRSYPQPYYAPYPPYSQYPGYPYPRY